MENEEGSAGAPCARDVRVGRTILTGISAYLESRGWIQNDSRSGKEYWKDPLGSRGLYRWPLALTIEADREDAELQTKSGGAS